MPMSEKVMDYFKQQYIPQEAIPLFFTDFCLFKMGPNVYSKDFFEQLYKGMHFILTTASQPITARYYIHLATIVSGQHSRNATLRRNIDAIHHAVLWNNATPVRQKYFMHLSEKGLPEFEEEISHINALAKEIEQQYQRSMDPQMKDQFEVLSMLPQIRLSVKTKHINNQETKSIRIQSRGQGDTELLTILFDRMAQKYEEEEFSVIRLLAFIRATHIIHYTADFNGRMVIFLLRFKELIRHNEPLPLTLFSFHFTGHSLEELANEHQKGLVLRQEFSMKKAYKVMSTFNEYDTSFQDALSQALSKNPLIACIQLNDLYIRTKEAEITGVILYIMERNQTKARAQEKSQIVSLVDLIRKHIDKSFLPQSICQELSTEEIMSYLNKEGIPDKLDALIKCDDAPGEFSIKRASELINKFQPNDLSFQQALINTLSNNCLIAVFQLNALCDRMAEVPIIRTLVFNYEKNLNQLLKQTENRVWDYFLMAHILTFSNAPSPAKSLADRLYKHEIYPLINYSYKVKLNKLLKDQHDLCKQSWADIEESGHGLEPRMI